MNGKGLMSRFAKHLPAALICAVALTGCPAGHDVAGGPAVMRRLTEAQYRNVVADIFGDGIELGGRFDPDPRAGHLIAIGAGRASVTASGLEQYDKIARSIGGQVVDEAHRRETMECQPHSATAPDDACTRRFLARVGRHLFRRPLTDQELTNYVAGAAVATAKTGDYYNGVALSLAAMLSSPRFLFWQETAEPDPDHVGQQRLDAHSMAQRLSLLLWNSAPDAALLAAAETGEMHSRKGLSAQVERLLASPRLEAGVRAFFADMLEFDRFGTLAKDAELYPKFNPAAGTQAQEQTLRTLVDQLLARHGDYRDVFTTRQTFLTPTLGSIYRVPVVVPDGRIDAWVPYEFAEASGKAGILTHLSFVALHSHPGRSSPTLRGKAVREIFLCTKVPDPPGNVDFSRFESPTGEFRTARERLAAHATDPTCAGCHKITDPVGLAFETFDTAGTPRTTDGGMTIRTEGDLDGVAFADAGGVGRAVRDNPQAATCLVERLLDYALGRPATASEAAWRSESLQRGFAADGYRLPELLRRIVLSDSFYRVAPAAGGETKSSNDHAEAGP